jgi:hypothetical protein
MSPMSPVYRGREIARYTCIRGFTGRNQIKSAVFDATTLQAITTPPPTPYVTIFGASGVPLYNVPIGSFLTKSTTDPTKVKVYQGLGANSNATQTLTETGVPTGGTFTLTYGSQTTAPIPYNATAAQVAAALAALSNVGSSANVSATGGALPGSPIVVTFSGQLGNQPQAAMTTNYAGLTGGTNPATQVTVTNAGSAAEQIIGVFDGPNRDFFGNASIAFDEAVPVYFHAVSFDISKLQGWTQYGTAAQAALSNCTFY